MGLAEVGRVATTAAQREATAAAAAPVEPGEEGMASGRVGLRAGALVAAERAEGLAAVMVGVLRAVGLVVAMVQVGKAERAAMGNP